jgi:hypothetical protein
MMCTGCNGIRRRFISRSTKMPVGFNRRIKRRFTSDNARDPCVVAHAEMMRRDEIIAEAERR